MTVPIPPEIAEVIDRYTPGTRAGVLRLRRLICQVARDMAVPVEEALRWGQPAYLSPRGTTLRLGPHKAASFALYTHCQSRVIPDFAAAFPGQDRLDGNRAVLFDRLEDVEPERLSQLIGHALRYHVKPSPKCS